MTAGERERGLAKAAPAHAADGELAGLFSRNRTWAAQKIHGDPGFFSRLVGQQHPRYFWIGCSDSRVPATEIVDLDPGEMFVHRNVANLAKADDPSFAAALQFAVQVLGVAHIIVTGHYGCGGIQAAMMPGTKDAIGNWLTPVRALHEAGAQECGQGPASAADALCERNVIAQVSALAQNPIVRGAWAAQAPLTLHGWVYAIGDGLLQPVCDPFSGPLVEIREAAR